jgi:hypothetical protein
MTSGQGITMGAIVGALTAYVLTRILLKKSDLGVVGAAAGAGALIGGALAAPALTAG